MIKIKNITTHYINDANLLANGVFDSREIPPSHALEASIDPAKFEIFKAELFDEHGIALVDLKYWFAVDTQTDDVLGVIGLYSAEDDQEEASWISWFCTGKKHRGKGVGTMLLEHVIAKTRDDMKSYVRLFTSTDPKEAAAQGLYVKMGFRIMEERGRKKRDVYEIFYRELSL